MDWASFFLFVRNCLTSGDTEVHIWRAPGAGGQASQKPLVVPGFTVQNGNALSLIDSPRHPIRIGRD